MRSSAADAARQMWELLAHERRLLRTADAEILQAQIDVAQIPAPTGAEERRADWVAGRLTALGLRVSRDGEGNVIATAPEKNGSEPVVVFAHLDTVFPADTRLHVARDGSRVAMPGICDNGRGLAVMLAVAGAVRRCGDLLARPVEFVATTGEEGAGDLRGAKHYFATAGRPFALVALDGAGDERIVNTALGSRRFRISYGGPGGHSWAAYGSVNPVHAAARCANSLASLRLPSQGPSALTVSRIGGGLSVNSISQDAWLEVDARSVNDRVLDQLEREVRLAADAACTCENQRRSPGTAALRFTIACIGRRPAGATSEDSPVVVAAVETTRLAGKAAELSTASTDANVAIAAGVPAIAIGGGGRGGDAHTPHEWFDNTRATDGVERALTIIATLARLRAA